MNSRTTKITVKIDAARKLKAAGHDIDYIATKTGLSNYILYFALHTDAILKEMEADGEVWRRKNFLNARKIKEAQK